MFGENKKHILSKRAMSHQLDEALTHLYSTEDYKFKRYDTKVKKTNEVARKVMAIAMGMEAYYGMDSVVKAFFSQGDYDAFCKKYDFSENKYTYTNDGKLDENVMIQALK